MNDNRGKKYLTSAIIWTVIALIALFVLMFMTKGGNTFGRISALALIVLCLAGQWLRWWKLK